MKKIILFLLVNFICFNILGQDLTKVDIKKTVQEFINDNQINKRYTIADINPYEFQNETVLYIIKLKPVGFIILANERRLNSVLAYSFEHNFTSPQPQSNISWWLKNYGEQVWTLKHSDNLLGAQVFHRNIVQNTTSVTPLLSTTWNQGSGYNQFCPIDTNGPGGHAWAGCVATAAGQIMKKWEHPAHGNGSYSYTHPVYGTLSADFENTNYNWTGMNTNISDVALLLYHIGVAVDMNYSPSNSSSSISKLSRAFEYIFNFHSSYLSRSNISDTDWVQTLKDELDNNRPLIYRGGTYPGGHAWACDGYDNNDLFHMNWGWGGYYDGYFSVNDLTPGNHNYNMNQAILYQIYPVSQYICSDPYEAGNNNLGIDNNIFRNVFSFDLPHSEMACLTPGDEDWYSFEYEYNGENEYIDILVKGADNQTAGPYIISANLSGHILSIETKQYGISTDTKLQWKCMSVNGTYPKVIMEDDNSGENGVYSKLVIDLDQVSRTPVVDQHFKNALYNMDIAYHPFITHVYTEYINHITNLQLNYKNIADFTGIEGFQSLQSLWCHHNNLTSLDVSQNHNLTELICRDNQLTQLTVNPEMEELFANRNQISDIQLTQCTNLTKLSLFSNNLQQLDLRNGNPYNLTELYLSNNPDLTCVFVDDANYMNTNWSNAIDATATYVETQAECDALHIDESFKESIQVNPNPFTDKIDIKVANASNIKTISIQNMQGQVVYKSDFAPQINLSNLSKGMYLLNIENVQGNQTVFKLIKD